MTDTDKEREWERGWDGHAAQQLARLARLPLAEKLRWLEEAGRLVRQLTALPPTTSPKA
jgi:hypothetical protein